MRMSFFDRWRTAPEDKTPKLDDQLRTIINGSHVLSPSQSRDIKMAGRTVTVNHERKLGNGRLGAALTWHAGAALIRLDERGAVQIKEASDISDTWLGSGKVSHGKQGPKLREAKGLFAESPELFENQVVPVVEQFQGVVEQITQRQAELQAQQDRSVRERERRIEQAEIQSRQRVRDSLSELSAGPESSVESPDMGTSPSQGI
jgi:hypothetical protein